VQPGFANLTSLSNSLHVMSTIVLPPPASSAMELNPPRRIPKLAVRNRTIETKPDYAIAGPSNVQSRTVEVKGELSGAVPDAPSDAALPDWDAIAPQPSQQRQISRAHSGSDSWSPSFPQPQPLINLQRKASSAPCSVPSR